VTEPLSADLVFRHAAGSWWSGIMAAAVELGIFAQLEEPRSPTDIALACSIQPRAALALLDGLVACGLAACRAERYTNTEVASFYLVPGQLQYLGDFVLLGAHSAYAWLQLAQVARDGTPLLDATTPGDDPAWKGVVSSITPLSLAAARAAADTLELDGSFELLDLGGGSGAFSVVWLSLSDLGHATQVDRADINRQAQDYAARFGVQSRFSTVDGEIFDVPLDQDAYDYVVLSQVLHFFAPSKCQSLLQRCRHALRPGGALVIADFVIGANPHPWALAFSANMLLSTEHGAALRRAELERWLSSAGFDEIGVEPVPGMPHTLVYAR